MSDMQVDSCDNTNNDQEEKEHTASPESYPEIKCRWAQCGEWFLSLHDLAGHVSHAHAVPAGQGLFYCRWDGCSRSHRGFNARYKMLVHVRTHTNEKPHQCNECNKCFSRAENLKIHARSHTGEKPYTCPIPGCDKAYSNSSDRFKHTRTHSIDKPYVCKVAGCDKRYTDPSSLRKHAKTYNHFPTHRTNHDQNSHQERDELEHAGAETRDKTSASRRVQLDYVTTHISTSWLQTLYPQRAWTEEQESPLDLTVHALKHAHPFH